MNQSSHLCTIRYHFTISSFIYSHNCPSTRSPDEENRAHSTLRLKWPPSICIRGLLFICWLCCSSFFSQCLICHTTHRIQMILPWRDKQEVMKWPFLRASLWNNKITFSKTPTTTTNVHENDSLSAVFNNNGCIDHRGLRYAGHWKIAIAIISNSNGKSMSGPTWLPIVIRQIVSILFPPVIAGAYYDDGRIMNAFKVRLQMNQKGWVVENYRELFNVLIILHTTICHW